MENTIDKQLMFNEIDEMIYRFYEPPKSPYIFFQADESYKVVPEEIEKLLNELDASFSERLMEIIREKDLNEVEVYKKADIDRRVFSKLRSFSDYRPSKDTAILLCMSMQLSYDETVDLLSRAGLAFSNSSKTDIITQYFFKKEIYDIPLFKETLFKFGALKDCE